MAPPKKETDGGYQEGLDERRLYFIVRKAVKDAILGVLRTVVLLGVALLMVIFGVSSAISGASNGILIGVTAIVLGIYCAVATLELVPTIPDLF